MASGAEAAVRSSPPLTRQPGCFGSWDYCRKMAFTLQPSRHRNRNGVADMVRFLIWIEGDENGWACSNCRWRFPVPTLLSGGEARNAYDRLADVKFREHQCEAETSLSAAKQETKRDAGTAFADRARMLIKRGYTRRSLWNWYFRKRRSSTAAIRRSWRGRVLTPRISFNEPARASSELRPQN